MVGRIYDTLHWHFLETCNGNSLNSCVGWDSYRCTMGITCTHHKPLLHHREHTSLECPRNINPMHPIAPVWAQRLPISLWDFYMEVLILGVILQYMVFASLTLYPLMATIVSIWPNWGFCRISKFNSCTFTTLSLKNLHHWFVFISDFRTYQVFSGPCVSQCIVIDAYMYISSIQLSWAWKSGYNGLTHLWF